MSTDTKAPEMIPFTTDAKIVRCWWSKHEGSYNILDPNKKQWSVAIRVELSDKSAVGVSETWDHDDEPNLVADDWPEEVIPLLSERLESYWISTRRPESRGKLAWMLDNIDQINLVWAEARLSHAQEEAKSAKAKRDRLAGCVADLKEEIAAKAKGGAS